ncbi:hypothetical protein P4O66_018647 [Electrophorus voltai]|uniref:Acyl-CoA dehydrogenase/oxidase N-terminal domain-containing protein n=1 Tax=Electrophorus voltai TaxID=2609070 RepID=A0AAD8YR01_9TELE|nr:hypothetical protein P4O66_018647 [Electrophorus voltai]
MLQEQKDLNEEVLTVFYYTIFGVIGVIFVLWIYNVGLKAEGFPKRKRQWEVVLRREGFTTGDSSALYSKHFKLEAFDRQVSTRITQSSGLFYALPASSTGLKARLSEALTRVENLEQKIRNAKDQERRAKNIGAGITILLQVSYCSDDAISGLDLLIRASKMRSEKVPVLSLDELMLPYPCRMLHATHVVQINRLKSSGRLQTTVHGTSTSLCTTERNSSTDIQAGEKEETNVSQINNGAQERMKQLVKEKGTGQRVKCGISRGLDEAMGAWLKCGVRWLKAKVKNQYRKPKNTFTGTVFVVLLLTRAAFTSGIAAGFVTKAVLALADIQPLGRPVARHTLCTQQTLLHWQVNHDRQIGVFKLDGTCIRRVKCVCGYVCVQQSVFVALQKSMSLCSVNLNLPVSPTLAAAQLKMERKLKSPSSEKKEKIKKKELSENWIFKVMPVEVCDPRTAWVKTNQGRRESSHRRTLTGSSWEMHSPLSSHSAPANYWQSGENAAERPQTGQRALDHLDPACGGSLLRPKDKHTLPVIDKDKKRCNPIHVFELSTTPVGYDNEGRDRDFDYKNFTSIKQLRIALRDAIARIGLLGSRCVSSAFHMLSLKPVMEEPLLDEEDPSGPSPLPLEMEGGPAYKKAGAVSRGVWEKAGSQGLLCVYTPAEHGGDLLSAAIVWEEQMYSNCSGPGFSLYSEIVMPYISHYGTQAQVELYIPQMAVGKCIGAIAMMEQGAGRPDTLSLLLQAWFLQNLQLAFTYESGLFLSQVFITNGWMSDLVVVVAVMNCDAKSVAHGLSLLLVENGTKEFHKGHKLDKIGLKA